jgi:hypothetical protein
MNFSVSHTGTDSGEIERHEPDQTMVVSSGVGVGMDMVAELKRLQSVELSHRRVLAALDRVAREYRLSVMPGGLINAPYSLALALDTLVKAVDGGSRKRAS